MRITAPMVNSAYLELAWALKSPPLLYKYQAEQMVLGVHEV